MIEHPKPVSLDEEKRLEYLNKLKILDSRNEQIFDDLVKVAAFTCDVPISLISLVDRDRQWFKANFGLPGVTQTEREVSFCAHTIESRSLLEVRDATLDARFAANPLVIESPGIRFYAGMPLFASDDSVLGALCVIDRQPRELTANQVEVLQALANTAIKIMESKNLNYELSVSEARFRTFSELSPVGIFVTDSEGKCTYTNEAWERIFNLSPLECLGDAWASTIHPDDKLAVFENWREAARAQSVFEMKFRIANLKTGVRHVSVRARPVLDRARLVTSYIGAVEDVTERELKYNSLKSERDHLRSVLDRVSLERTETVPISG